MAYHANGDYNRAEEDFSEALRICPCEAMLYYCRGMTRFAKNDYERATEDFSKALELCPDYFFVYENRGETYYAQGDFARAEADFTEALRFTPDDHDIQNKLNKAAKGVGKTAPFIKQAGTLI